MWAAANATKGYGIYDPSVTFKAPLVENMTNQLPEDYAKTVAYPWFREILTEAANGCGWTWTEVCPDVVVGFSPYRLRVFDLAPLGTVSLFICL